MEELEIQEFKTATEDLQKKNTELCQLKARVQTSVGTLDKRLQIRAFVHSNRTTEYTASGEPEH